MGARQAGPYEVSTPGSKYLLHPPQPRPQSAKQGRTKSARQALMDPPGPRPQQSRAGQGGTEGRRQIRSGDGQGEHSGMGQGSLAATEQMVQEGKAGRGTDLTLQCSQFRRRPTSPKPVAPPDTIRAHAGGGGVRGHDQCPFLDHTALVCPALEGSLPLLPGRAIRVVTLRAHFSISAREATISRPPVPRTVRGGEDGIALSVSAAIPSPLCGQSLCRPIAGAQPPRPGVSCTPRILACSMYPVACLPSPEPSSCANQAL